jgi:hypothetical protein
LTRNVVVPNRGPAVGLEGGLGMASRELTVEGWLADFAACLRRLESHDGRVSHVCSMFHGFEGWLKFEMAALLCRKPWNYRGWLAETPGDVGLEYRAVLRGKETKLIDLWASPKPKAKHWHFVELKVAFDNPNATKQFAAWRGDFEILRTLDHRQTEQKVKSIGSVLFAYDLPKTHFEERVRTALKDLVPCPRLARHEVELANSKVLRIVALVD